jgi:hypothetical protein
VDLHMSGFLGHGNRRFTLRPAHICGIDLHYVRKSCSAEAEEIVGRLHITL